MLLFLWRTLFSELGNPLQTYIFATFCLLVKTKVSQKSAERRNLAWWSDCCLSVVFQPGSPNVACPCSFLLGSGHWVGDTVSVFSRRIWMCGPLVIYRARSGVLVCHRHGRGAASCASGGGRSVRACAVRCADAVHACFSTDLSWRCVAAICFYKPTFWAALKAASWNQKILFLLLKNILSSFFRTVGPLQGSYLATQDAAATNIMGRDLHSDGHLAWVKRSNGCRSPFQVRDSLTSMTFHTQVNAVGREPRTMCSLHVASVVSSVERKYPYKELEVRRTSPRRRLRIMEPGDR